MKVRSGLGRPVLSSPDPLPRWVRSSGDIWVTVPAQDGGAVRGRDFGPLVAAFRFITESLPAMAIALLPFGVTFAVLRRYFFGQPVPIVNESTILIVMWTVYLALPKATRDELHPSLDFIRRPKSPSLGRSLDRVRDGVMLVILVALIYFGYQFTVQARLTFLTLGIGKNWAWAALPIGALLTSSYLVVRFWRPTPPAAISDAEADATTRGA